MNGKWFSRARCVTATTLVLASPLAALASTPAELLAGWRQQGAGVYSAQRGRALFNDRSRSDWACSTCHTADPRQPGQHATTQRRIEPLSPRANAQRFTDPAKVEKWFRRNCRDVLQRECTATEKGDVLTWLLEPKP